MAFLTKDSLLSISWRPVVPILTFPFAVAVVSNDVTVLKTWEPIATPLFTPWILSKTVFPSLSVPEIKNEFEDSFAAHVIVTTEFKLLAFLKAPVNDFPEAAPPGSALENKLSSSVASTW